MSSARVLAVEALLQVEFDGAYANILTNEILSQNDLSSADAGMFTDLVNGTLRWERYLDTIIKYCSSREIVDLSDEVRSVLRLSTYSYLIRGTQAHAIVNEGVETIRNLDGERATSFVNAVLRRITERTAEEWRIYADQRVEDADQEAIMYSLPNWIVKVFQSQIPDQLERIALFEKQNQPPSITYLRRPGTETDTTGLAPGNWSPYALREIDKKLSRQKLKTGELTVQDEGSQLTSWALSMALIEGPDLNWLDMTAGPGGKAVFLAAIAQMRGAKLVANEIHPHRAELVRNVLRRSELNAEILIGDANFGAWAPKSFDRVLLDAPCTGLGALRRRAESRWRRTEKDLADLVIGQRKLLRSAIAATRSGGIVGYVTCSLHPRETTEIVLEAAKTHKIEFVDVPRLLPGIPLAPGPFLQLWPHRHDTDGMFMAILRVE
jgi:16S rRNA (cytosine967-C5)-methyltransferase